MEIPRGRVGGQGSSKAAVDGMRSLQENDGKNCPRYHIQAISLTPYPYDFTLPLLCL